MISIIIPVYNQADKITMTIRTILAQSYQDFEVIIVNDGSTDGLEAVLENILAQVKTNNTFFIIHQNNQGAPAARNRGLKEAKGEYVLFCDADATLDFQALEIMKQNLDAHPEASYVYSSFLWGKKLFNLGPFDAEKLRQGPYIHTMSLVRRADLPPGGWDVNIKKLQDWDLWLTMLENGHTGYWIQRVLFKVQPGGTISSWLPAFAYSWLPFLPAVKKYQAAVKIVKDKHAAHLTEIKI